MAHRRSLPERALAWLVTGPVGHLLAGLYDALRLVAHLARVRFSRSR